MESYIDGISIINGIAIFLFSMMAVIGTIGIFQCLGDYSALENQTISYAALFTVGSFGLIVELLIYNLKSLKK